MKLGFAIKVVNEGAGEPMLFGRGSWVRKVVDKRDYLKLFSGLQGTDNHIAFLTFDEGGCFLTIMKSLSGRAGDSLSGWVYIPNDVDITGQQMVEVYNFVCGVLQETNITRRQDDIEDFFSTSYPAKQKPLKYAPTRGDRLAYRYTDERHTLADLLGECRYQNYYSGYQAVFILPQHGEVRPQAALTNLSDKPLQSYCILEAPDRRTLDRLGTGTSLYIKETDTPLTTDAQVAKGTTVALIARRPGFCDETVQIMVGDPVTRITYDKKLPWKVLLTPQCFHVLGHDGKPVDGARITLDGNTLTDKGLLIPEEQLANIKYTVSAHGYDDQQGTATFQSGAREITVTLHRRIRTIDHNIVLKDNSVAQVSFKVKGMAFADPNESPLKGYSYSYDEDNNSRALDLDSAFLWNQRLIRMACVVAHVQVEALCTAQYSRWDSADITSEFPIIQQDGQQDADKAGQTTPVNPSFVPADTTKKPAADTPDAMTAAAAASAGKAIVQPVAGKDAKQPTTGKAATTTGKSASSADKAANATNAADNADANSASNN